MEPIVRCKALTKAGPRCIRSVVDGSDFCTYHDPAREAARQAQAAAGAARRIAKRSARIEMFTGVLRTSADVLLALESAARKLTAPDATEIDAKLANSIAAVAKAAAGALRVQELEREVEQLRAQVVELLGGAA